MSGPEAKDKAKRNGVDNYFQGASLKIEDEGRLWLWKIGPDTYIGVRPETEEVLWAKQASHIRAKHNLRESRARREQAGLIEVQYSDAAEERHLAKLHAFQRAWLTIKW